MSHDQFGKIPQSPELQQRILQAELDTVEENLEVLRQQGKNVSRAMLKGLEKRKHNLEAKLEKVEHAIKSRTDDVVDFKQMGIDHIADGLSEISIGRGWVLYLFLSTLIEAGPIVMLPASCANNT